jgi:Apea-like HEPN
MFEILWFWRYVPCAGVKLDFDEFVVHEIDGRAMLVLTRNENKPRSKILKKHILEDSGRSFSNLKTVDFELSVASLDRDGNFEVTRVHAFSFLLMIKTGGWIDAPVFLTHSTLHEPDKGEPHVICMSFLHTSSSFFGDFKLTLEDAEWIKTHLETTLELIEKPKFQNAMQAMTSFHLIPFSNMALVTAWSGLEALFEVKQEISFKLGVYITNYLYSNAERASEFEKLKQSYDDRSRVAHGESTKTKAVFENAYYTRDILRACLRKCIETKSFPVHKNLVF